MTVRDVANQLVALCRAGKFEEAMNTFYADDIISIEAVGDEQMPAEMRGIEAVRGKAAWWVGNHEVHRAEILGPYYNAPNPNQFCIHMSFDVTFKPTGEKKSMNEVGLYEVENGKVVKETFYYDMAPED